MPLAGARWKEKYYPHTAERRTYATLASNYAHDWCGLVVMPLRLEVSQLTQTPTLMSDAASKKLIDLGNAA